MPGENSQECGWCITLEKREYLQNRVSGIARIHAPRMLKCSAREATLPLYELPEKETTVKKRLILKCILASLIATPLSFADRPNIVLIMADDLGLGDVSHHVRTQQGKVPVVETPAIDALAKDGLWFTDGHSATALCSPTRYCVMSGNNNYRSNAPWGVWGAFRQTAFKEGEVTLGTVVRDAGYTTGFVGKWHLGGDFRNAKTGGIYRGKDNGDLSGSVDLTRMVSNGPRDWGFDYDFTLPCGIQGPIYTAYENNAWYPLGTDSKIIFLNQHTAINAKDLSSKGEGMGDSAWEARDMGKVLSVKAVDFIEAQAAKPGPFFLYYCSPMVHLPHCPPDTFDGQKVRGVTPSPHLDMMIELDLEVKRIVDALKAQGVYDNTLLVFTSDNGGLAVDKAASAAGHRSSGGWAGAKNSPFEGGHRVPTIAVWPGHITPGVTDEPMINQDMVATFAALVGTPIPEGQAQDSQNLLPLLTGKGTFRQRDFMVQQAGSKQEVFYRKMPWKLILQSNAPQTKFEPIGLYNLKIHPRESKATNLINDPDQKARVEKLKNEYLDIVQSRRSTLPSNSPN